MLAPELEPSAQPTSDGSIAHGAGHSSTVPSEQAKAMASPGPHRASKMPEVCTCATGYAAGVRQLASRFAGLRGDVRPNLQPGGADSSSIEEVEHARAALLIDKRVGSNGERSAAVRVARGSAARLKLERALC